MKKILFGVAATVVMGVTAAAGVAAAGALDFAADTPHSPLVADLISWARERAIVRAASGIVPPSDLADPERVRRGAGNYDAMCAQCHSSPGAPPSEISRGLYPAPANLAEPGADHDAAAAEARRFWIVKHGIKGSGMPAWAKGGIDDNAIWDLVAFVKILPGLTADTYRQQVAASDGHAHSGLPAGPVATDSHPHGHAHKGHKHAH